MKIKLGRIAILAALINLVGLTSAYGCTDFLIKAQDGSVIVGRSLEWGDDMKSQISAHPRGEERSSEIADGRTGLRWKSKFGYVAANAYGLDVALDGMNEKGLSYGALWFPGAVYQSVPSGEQAPAINAVDAGAWILGNFATVNEATSAIANICVCARKLSAIEGLPTLHIALHDATGNSAVVEFRDGKQHIWPNPNGVLTNAPDFQWHITNLRNYLHISPINPQPLSVTGSVLAPPGQGEGFLGIPGDWTPPSRFVRTTAMLGYAYPPKDARGGIRLAQHILNAVDIPLGDVRDKLGAAAHTDYTQWAVIKDLSNGVLYYRSYDSLALNGIDLKRLAFDLTDKNQHSIPVSHQCEIADMTDKLAH